MILRFVSEGAVYCFQTRIWVWLEDIYMSVKNIGVFNDFILFSKETV